MSSQRALTVSLFILFIFLILVWQNLPLQDAADYFNFADQRNFLGIQNALDVLSNLGFLFVGIYGILVLKKSTQSLNKELLLLGYLFSLSIVLVSVGSAYFHLNPNTQTLFWDRLPMTLAFSAISSILVIDKIDKKIGLLFAVLLIPLSALTVIGWSSAWFSLRFYLAVQFGSIVFVLLLVLLRSSGLIKNQAVYSMLGLYILAKILESYDSQIFLFTNFISGHTLKHLAATVAIFIFINSFKKIKST